MRLRVSHQHSQFRPILARFMEYYLMFCGPGVIFPRLANPRVCLLVDSDPFHGQLLIVLGSQSDLHDS